MIAANVEELNQFLSHDLNEPIRFGIGIHGGEVIIGDIGYRDHMVFTALGDAVNVAARLQDMTKTLGCETIFSEQVRITAGLAADSLPAKEVAIRGRSEPMIVRTISDAKVWPRWSMRLRWLKPAPEQAFRKFSLHSPELSRTAFSRKATDER